MIGFIDFLSEVKVTQPKSNEYVEFVYEVSFELNGKSYKNIETTVKNVQSTSTQTEDEALRNVVARYIRNDGKTQISLAIRQVKAAPHKVKLKKTIVKKY